MIKKRLIKSLAKKTVAVSLVTAMSASMLSGCGKSKKTDNGPITLTVFSERANYNGEQVGWSAQILEEKFNIKLNIIPNTNGAVDTRMASGDLGDLIVFGSEADYLKAMNAGLLFDWEEDGLLDDVGSYMKENMSANLEKNRNMSEDGKIYGLGYDTANSDDVASFLYTWDIRWDLYEQLGHPEVNNLDDYVEVLKQMKEICPTDDAGNPTYAFSLWPDWDGNMVMYVKSMATAYYGYDEFGVGLYNPVDGHFYGSLGNPNDASEESPYIEMIHFFNTLYQNDLLDPDSMTATYDTMIEKVDKSGVFCSIFNYAGYMQYNKEGHIAENKIYKSLVPKEASPICYGLNALGGNNYWAIGAKTEYPDLVMELINWLCTPEGVMTYSYGPQGVCWDYDEDGNTYFTELGKKTNADKETAMPEPYSGKYKDGELQINCITWDADASNPDSNGETFNCANWKSEQTDPVCDADSDWREFTGCTSIDEYMRSGNYIVAPGSAYVQSEQSDELKTTWAQVAQRITEGTWSAIYAKSDKECDKIIDSMIKDAYDFGYEECWNWSNDEAARRKAAEDEVSK